MNYNFTADYVTLHEKTWESFLNSYAGLPNLRFLEIGSYEGRSTVWFLEKILTHPSSKITCIDHNFRKNFYLNMAPFSDKVSLISDDSQAALRDKKFLQASFDVIYIDGSHAAYHVLEDAILALPSLKTGGLMIFDDYLWNEPVTEKSSAKRSPEEIRRQEPKLAIDAFTSVFGDAVEIIYKDYQVICKKNAL